MYEGNPRRDEAGVAEERTGISPALIGFVVLAILAVVFVIQNSTETSIEFLFLDVRAAVWVAIAVSIGIGVVLDRLFGIWWRRRRRD